MSLKLISRFLAAPKFARAWYQLAITTLILGSALAITSPTRADSSKLNPPPALKTLLANVDAAANGRKLPELSRYYSSNFTTSDGLNKAGWQQSLGQFWQNYSKLTYTTTLEGWKAAGNGYTANTVTKIVGVQNVGGRTFNLQSTIASEQQIVGGQIVQQQILQERTQVSSGAKPPTIVLNLPTKIPANTEYNLDAIVTEPLGEDVLMGATIEQPVSLQAYTQAPKYKLELLTAGGLFKVARAPGKSGDYWFSTIFIRPAGMTTLTQRVHVVREK
ncbi:nuclear transport factor 2 family protein [Chamaesiphon sp.]|uniref:nuclear transport factor 2 family protein n=1 Tax=Chamaesiphon sp. TaxID=2814140 RepID=UPI00359428D8